MATSKKQAEDLRKLSPMEITKVGWGFIKVKAKVGKSEWATTLFPDRKNGVYLIAIKADVRKKENIEPGNGVKVGCELV